MTRFLAGKKKERTKKTDEFSQTYVKTRISQFSQKSENYPTLV
jgi:hypothetical protein